MVASEKETYELCYFQISQDEAESDYMGIDKAILYRTLLRKK